MSQRVVLSLVVLTALGWCVADRAAAQGRSADAERTRAWAKRLIERYDKNGNKMLDKDERANLRGKPAGADLNSDDVITLNELITHLSSDASPPPRPQTPEPAESASTSTPAAPTESGTAQGEQQRQPSRRSESSVKTSSPKTESLPLEKRRRTASDVRKSYRFKSPDERLPAGLPGWFLPRDANHDGQVAMSEYSRSWTDRTAEEFCRLDKNNDGFITPGECLR